MKSLTIMGLLATTGLIFLAACSGPPSGNHLINQQQRNVDKQAALTVGFPNITNFAEKRELKLIYELRDHMFPTITYLKGFHGHLHKMCDSIGYGIPYSTQYSNPLRVHDNLDQHQAVLPQADPNGLYSAPESAATWVLCYDPQTKQVEPVYAEPDVVVSQFPLDNVAKPGAVIHLTGKQITAAVQAMSHGRR
ncbi:MAG: hypothetical protein ACYCOU_01250 [Sulfobacillus sp.]